MNSWFEYSPADFDGGKAPKYIRQAAEQGQEQLFATGTPVAAPKREQQQPAQLDGQCAMFGAEED